MFDYPGKKIKILAKALFWLVGLGSILASFILGWKEQTYMTAGAYHSYTVFQGKLFFGLFFGGPIGAYLFSLLLTAFGDLVENTERAAINTGKIPDPSEKKECGCSDTLKDQLGN